MTVKVLFIWLKLNLIKVKKNTFQSQYNFVRQFIDEGRVLIKKVDTQKNCANMFTKLITLEKLRWCIDFLVFQKR